jgi:hypothetical protein
MINIGKKLGMLDELPNRCKNACFRQREQNDSWIPKRRYQDKTKVEDI